MVLWAKRYSLRKGVSGGPFEFGIQYTAQNFLAYLLSVSQEVVPWRLFWNNCDVVAVVVIP
jgi:hypothetical protein